MAVYLQRPDQHVSNMKVRYLSTQLMDGVLLLSQNGRLINDLLTFFSIARSRIFNACGKRSVRKWRMWDCKSIFAAHIYLVVETGRAPSQHRLIVSLSCHFVGLRRGTPRLYNWMKRLMRVPVRISMWQFVNWSPWESIISGQSTSRLLKTKEKNSNRLSASDLLKNGLLF